MILEYYLDSFAIYEPLIGERPSKELDLIVTIPCYNEEERNIDNLINSLFKSYRKEYRIEIIFLINESENEKKEIKNQNQKTFEFIKKIKKESEENNLRIYSFYLKNIPQKKFGIGYARKVLCDEAIWRFKEIDKEKGIIVTLDADCRVKENYFDEIIKNFKKDGIDFAHVYFEHPYEDLNDEKLKKGIIYYEIFLRYYKNALLWANYPYVSYTIGSCLAFTADTYARFGGFKTKRKAGEDFYFVQKILPNVKFSEITETTVYPEARISERVPFGTGKALKDFIEGKKKFYYTIPFEPFMDLTYLKDFVKGAIDLKDLPRSLKRFLLKEKVIKKTKEIKEKTSDFKSYVKKFYLWFDLLKVWRFIRFCLNQKFYEEKKLEESINDFLIKINVEIREKTPENILEKLREYDKNHRIKNKNMFDEFYKKWIKE